MTEAMLPKAVPPSTRILAAAWVLPVTEPPIADGVGGGEGERSAWGGRPRPVPGARRDDGCRDGARAGPGPVSRQPAARRALPGGDRLPDRARRRSARRCTRVVGLPGLRIAESHPRPRSARALHGVG